MDKRTVFEYFVSALITLAASVMMWWVVTMGFSDELLCAVGLILAFAAYVELVRVLVFAGRRPKR